MALVDKVAQHSLFKGRSNERPRRRLVDWSFLYARATLGVAFLSGIADRFGLWRGRNVGSGNFAAFVRYTAQVNSFMPASSIPFLAWTATIAELVLGILLLAGCGFAGRLWPVRFYWYFSELSWPSRSASSRPLDYSVFSASATAILLALNERRAVDR